jgi:hypothetical protein
MIWVDELGKRGQRITCRFAKAFVSLTARSKERAPQLEFQAKAGNRDLGAQLILQ